MTNNTTLAVPPLTSTPQGRNDNGVNNLPAPLLGVPGSESALTAQQFMPLLQIDDILTRHNMLVQFKDRVLRPGTDFGIIPGTGDKPTLLKPGAEKLCSLYGLTPCFHVVQQIEDWTGEDHNNEPFFYYWFRCRLYRGGYLIAEGDGSCNSREVKYRWRKRERTCPVCQVAAIRKSQEEGYYCWRKQGGCGKQFSDNDPSIINQPIDRIPNPDIADQVNTIQKMGEKRALIAATLIAVNASDFFTQDVEDIPLDAEIVDGASPTGAAPRGATPGGASPTRNQNGGRTNGHSTGGNGNTQRPGSQPQNGTRQNGNRNQQPSNQAASNQPPTVRTPRFRELIEEARQNGWAVDEGQTEVNRFRLLNAIRSEGFRDEFITDENFNEAVQCARRHYIKVQPQAQTQMQSSTVASDADMVLPSAEVQQSSEYQYFLEAAAAKGFGFATPEDRRRFGEAISNWQDTLVLVEDMTAPDFTEATEAIAQGMGW